MFISSVLIAVFCYTGGLGNADKVCGLNRYYNPNTQHCHPCSDCSDGRTGNVFCEKGCKGQAIDIYGIG